MATSNANWNKAQQWYFAMKLHIGVGSQSALALANIYLARQSLMAQVRP